jgi:hypothetical protein
LTSLKLRNSNRFIRICSRETIRCRKMPTKTKPKRAKPK